MQRRTCPGCILLARLSPLRNKVSSELMNCPLGGSENTHNFATKKSVKMKGASGAFEWMRRSLVDRAVSGGGIKLIAQMDQQMASFAAELCTHRQLDSE